MKNNNTNNFEFNIKFVSKYKPNDIILCNIDGDYILCSINKIIIPFTNNSTCIIESSDFDDLFNGVIYNVTKLGTNDIYNVVYDDIESCDETNFINDYIDKLKDKITELEEEK